MKSRRPVNSPVGRYNMKVPKLIVFIVALCFVLLSLPLLVMEWRHYRTYGHFVSYGLHVDVFNRDTNIGIQGRTKEYRARLSNFTLSSAKLTFCRTPGDTTMPPRQTGWAVQRYAASTGWQTVMDVTEGGFCRSLMSDDVVEVFVKPGDSADLTTGAVGLVDPFRKGDLARFVIFRKTVPRGDWQTAIYSVPFVIEDDVVRDKDGFLAVQH